MKPSYPEFYLKLIIIWAVIDVILFSLLASQVFPEISLGDNGICKNAFGNSALGCYSHDLKQGFVTVPSFFYAAHEHLHHLGFNEASASLISVISTISIIFLSMPTIYRWLE